MQFKRCNAPSCFNAIPAILLALVFSWSHALKAQTLVQPATGYSQFLTEGIPVLTNWNSQMILSYAQSGGASNSLLQVASSSDGVNFSNSVTVPQASLWNSPAPALNGQTNTMYFFYADSGDGSLKQVSTQDGVNFSSSQQLNLYGGGGPIYTNYNSPPAAYYDYGSGLFYIVWTDPNSLQLRIGTTDGTFVYTNYQVGSGLYTNLNKPSVLEFGPSGDLLVGFQANNHMLVMEDSLNGGQTWSEQTYPGILMGSGPSLVAYNGNVLYVSFVSNDNYHVLFQTTGTNYANLSSPARTYYNNIRSSSSSSCLFANLFGPQGDRLFCAIRSNDSYSWTFIAHGN